MREVSYLDQLYNNSTSNEHKVLFWTFCIELYFALSKDTTIVSSHGFHYINCYKLSCDFNILALISLCLARLKHSKHYSSNHPYHRRVGRKQYAINTIYQVRTQKQIQIIIRYTGDY